MDPRDEAWPSRSPRETRCRLNILAFSSSVSSSRALDSTPLPGVPDMGRRALIPPNEDGSPALANGMDSNSGELPAALGVPIGVPRRGMLGGGGVPAYCARRNLGLGEPEIAAGAFGGVPRSGALERGLAISSGLDGDDMMVGGRSCERAGEGIGCAPNGAAVNPFRADLITHKCDSGSAHRLCLLFSPRCHLLLRPLMRIPARMSQFLLLGR